MAGVDALAAAEARREAAIHLLALRLSSHVVAPLLGFALLGLPGAVLMRFSHTAAQLWHGGTRAPDGTRREAAAAGRWAARADALLGWVPARLTALLIAVASGAGGLRALAPLRLAVARLSPPLAANQAWPLAAMGLALGLRWGLPTAGAGGAASGGTPPAGEADAGAKASAASDPPGAAHGGDAGAAAAAPAGVDGRRRLELADTVRACAVGSRCVLAVTLGVSAALLAALA